MGSPQSQAPLIPQSREQLFDFYRASLKANSDATRVSLVSTVRLRTTQLRHIDEALAEHARLAAEVDAAKGLEDLVALGAKLAGAHYQTLISYWGAIYEAIGENQVEVARLAQSQMGHIRGDLAGALGTAPGVPAPVLSSVPPSRQAPQRSA